MSAIRRARRRRTIGAFAVGLLSLAAVPVLGVIAVDALRTSREGRNAIGDLLPLVAIPHTPGVLLATIDDMDAVTSMTVLALAPPAGDGTARGGTAISVPVTADANLSSGELVTVGDAYLAGGVDELQAAAEGLLGVTMSATIVADESTTARLLRRVAPLELDLPAAVHDTTAVGRDLTVFPAGPIEMGADDIAALLLAHTADDTAADLYERSTTVWSAISARIGDGLAADGAPMPPTAAPDPSTAPSLDDPAGTTSTAAPVSSAAPPSTAPPSTAPPIDPAADPDGFVDAFLSGPVGFYRLNPVPVASGGTERIRLNLAEVNFVMATVLPGAISPSFASITFYVRSPLGDPSLTLDAVAMLIFSGANVVLVKEDSTITVPEASTLQVANEDDLRDARRFTQAFGAFDEIQPEVRIEGVDAILTLGESFRTLMADADADAGTSTTGAANPTRTTDSTTTTTITDGAETTAPGSEG